MPTALPLWELPLHRPKRSRNPFIQILFLLFGLCCPPMALADCECGYLASINGTGDTNPLNTHHAVALFTDLLETDFTRPLANDNNDKDNYHHSLIHNPDWAPQAFNLTHERARGDHGEMFAAENVRVTSATGREGGAKAALELVVRSELVDGMVPAAELDTRRLDLFWGTFRVMMKVSSVKGTCAAFFWYFNDTQEIDMEFLSKDFNASNQSYPVNLVLQSREAAMAGYDAAKTGNFVKVHLPFDPTGDFHEYRIDYLPGRVFFYADGVTLAEMDGPAVPASPGHLILQHWSNGNKYWSGGPPAEDAALVVKYVKAYFNSSTVQRQQDWENRCQDPAAPGAVCRVPGITPGNSSAADWFFTDQGNMTNNQTTSEQSEGSRLMEPWWFTIAWLLVCGGWAVVLYNDGRSI